MHQNRDNHLNELHNIGNYVTLGLIGLSIFEEANENQGDSYLCQLSLFVITGYQCRIIIFRIIIYNIDHCIYGY